MALVEGGDDALGVVLLGDLRHQPFGGQHHAGAAFFCFAGEGGDLGPLGHVCSDHDSFGGPAARQAFADNPRALGEEEAGLRALFFPLKAFQGLDQRV